MEMLWDLQILNDIILQLAEVSSYREVRIDAVRTEVTNCLPGHPGHELAVGPCRQKEKEEG